MNRTAQGTKEETFFSLLKILSGLLLLCLSIYASALQTPKAPSADDGIEQAEKLCRSMGFPNEVLKCVKLVSAAKYFDAKAVDVCAKRSFPSEKQVCLETIQNLEYSATSIETCLSLSFSSKILGCLKEAGRPAAVLSALKQETRSTTSDQIEEEIRRAVRQLEAGNPRRARNILRGVLGEMQNESEHF